MEKVYVLCHDTTSDSDCCHTLTDVVGVFTDYEKAENVRRNLNNSNKWGSDYYSVEEYTLNELVNA